MAAETERKEPIHCDCGQFGSPSLGGHCQRCYDLAELRRENSELGQCRVENKRLIGENSSLSSKNRALQSKRNHPIRIRVKEWNGTCDVKYLDKLLTAIGPVGDTVIVAWERR